MLLIVLLLALSSTTTQQTIQPIEPVYAAEVKQPPVCRGEGREYVSCLLKGNPDKGELLAVMNCESGFNQKAVGKAGEIGLGQFMPSTWRAFNTERKTDLDIRSLEDQVEMMEWAWKHGKQNHWTCYKMLTKQ
jgi:soluble lytic murein transglycosylase-like protein